MTTRAESVTQRDAAKLLGVSVAKIGMLIASNHLKISETKKNGKEITLESIAKEKEWRESATIKKKIHRFIKDTLTWL